MCLFGLLVLPINRAQCCQSPAPANCPTTAPPSSCSHPRRGADVHLAAGQHCRPDGRSGVCFRCSREHAECGSSRRFRGPQRRGMCSLRGQLQRPAVFWQPLHCYTVRHAAARPTAPACALVGASAARAPRWRHQCPVCSSRHRTATSATVMQVCSAARREHDQRQPHRQQSLHLHQLSGALPGDALDSRLRHRQRWLFIQVRCCRAAVSVALRRWSVGAQGSMQ